MDETLASKIELITRLEKLRSVNKKGGINITIDNGSGGTWVYMILFIALAYIWYTRGFMREGFTPSIMPMYGGQQMYPQYYQPPLNLSYKYTYPQLLANEYMQARRIGW